MAVKVGVSREEKGLPYYRFYTQPLAPIPEEKQQILAAGPSPVPGVPFGQRNLFLESRDTDFWQVGYLLSKDSWHYWELFAGSALRR